MLRCVQSDRGLFKGWNCFVVVGLMKYSIPNYGGKYMSLKHLKTNSVIQFKRAVSVQASL